MKRRKEKLECKGDRKTDIQIDRERIRIQNAIKRKSFFFCI